MVTRIAVVLLCVAGLSGCASFISGGTGTEPVGTENGARTLGQVFIDNSIERTSKINMYKLDSRFKQSRINIESFHSNVLLTGQVEDPYLKKLAEDNLRAMSDVKTVHNYITVGDKVGYNTIMQDAAVTANARRLIMKAPVVSDSKVQVHTEDGVLYVMGRLNTAEINDLNNVLQQVGNVTKIVMLVDNLDTTNTPAVNAQPGIQTPVAIELDQIEPTNVQ